jgi:hypothetical protein
LLESRNGLDIGRAGHNVLVLGIHVELVHVSLESFIIHFGSIFKILLVFDVLDKFNLVPHFFAWVSNSIFELVNFDLNVEHWIFRVWESVVDHHGGSLLILTLNDGVLIQESDIFVHAQRCLELVNLLENILALALVR